MSNGSETAETIHKAGKVHLADNLRLMADNQQTLNTTRADDRRSRDLHARVEEAKAKEKVAGLAPAAGRKIMDDEAVRINIDSPMSTVNHHHPPAARQQTGTLLYAYQKMVLVAALVAGGAGLGVGIPLLLDGLKPSPAVAPVAPDEDTLFELRLVPAKTTTAAPVELTQEHGGG